MLDKLKMSAANIRLSWSNLMLQSLVWLLILNIIPSCLTLLHKGLGSEDEIRLVDFLFNAQGYNPLIRPVSNLSDNVTVMFGMAMIQLINVDEKNQIMKSNVWLRMQWSDYQLQWDPMDYGDIKTIRIISHKVWKPDIVLFNNADGKYEVSYKPNVVISHTGHVLWIPPAIYKSSCTIDVRYFPFDEQQCEMKFGSWTFNGDQVALDWYEKNQKVDLSDYVTSGTWDIIGCPGVYSYSWDSVEKHHKAQITFTLKIRRKTLFYTVNLIIPCVLISFLSVCVFYLPADAGEKMTMCISILLALVVFLLLVSKILPPTSISIPLIARYLLFTFLMNIVTIVITVIIINWNFRTPRTHRMTRWVRVIFIHWLPRILLMVRPNHVYFSRCRTKNSEEEEEVTQTMLEEDFDNQSKSSNSCRRDSIMRDLRRLPTIDLDRSQECSTPCNTLTSGKDAAWTEALGRGRMHEASVNSTAAGSPVYDGRQRAPEIVIDPEAKIAVAAVRYIADNLKREDGYAQDLEDWRYIALVIDRLQLLLFLAVTIGGTVGTLLNAPHIIDIIIHNSVENNRQSEGCPVD